MASEIRNILFIMFDQLRFDYLSCAGHAHLETPHMDALAARGVRFSRAYVQSTICGASRMSFYTGRYVASHGAAWNNFPLKVGEMTLGDHLRKRGMRSWLIGKTHMKADDEGMDRLGISRDSIIGARVSECGFDVHTRDDGLWAQGEEGFYDTRRSPYNEYLNAKGYDAENPWANNANAGIDGEGNIASGWLMKNAGLAANVAEEDSETPWLTSRAIDFLDSPEAQEPWLCHLSYIKPHWPYIVPAPYNDMYGRQHIQRAIRDERERRDPHPVYAEFMEGKVGSSFARDEVRDAVIPAYMGLVKQCDDQMGRLFAHLEKIGRMADTMIVLTSDHGDYLGDHWLGEKELFHDPSVRIPLIVYDPRKEADAARGTVCDALVESIDLAPTFMEAIGATIPNHILEGRSLTPLLKGDTPEDWRDFAISEYDYSATPIADRLGLAPKDARMFMVVTERWKMIHSEGGFRPMLFDLDADPQEFDDLGDSPEHRDIIEKMYDYLFAWARRSSQRTTVSDDLVRSMRKNGSQHKGILLGVYDEDDIEPNLLTKYRGKASTPPDRAQKRRAGQN
ncbi:MAG: sulfatase-like hydrolase/transferase [Rhizobiaceae bacterium]|nr:sulfatase-like hydrolase/transferase [Rhizobiaceae bacterium]